MQAVGEGSRLKTVPRPAAHVRPPSVRRAVESATRAEDYSGFRTQPAPPLKLKRRLETPAGSLVLQVVDRAESSTPPLYAVP